MSSPTQDQSSEAMPDQKIDQKIDQNQAVPAAAATDDKSQKKDAGSEVAKLTTEKAELNDRLLRLAAEFENYKRRIRKENEEAGIRTIESLLKEILPPLDNLDRALVAARANESTSTGALIEGVQMVQKLFFAALEKFQVKPFDAQGQQFDPNFHEAVQQVDSDTLPPGSVATVFQRGYFIGNGNRLLRPALVAVVRGRSQNAPDGGGAQNLN
jgi:molecular chaperone GrpE